MTSGRRRERLWATGTPPEVVRDLAPVPLRLGVERVLAPSWALRRDIRVPACRVEFRDGHVVVGGERFALRRRAARQLAGLVMDHRDRPVSAAAVRRGLRARGTRLLLVRLDGFEVRAILGAGFLPVDDEELFRRLAHAIDAMGWARRLVVRFIAMSEVVTVVRATLTSTRTNVFPSDAFERGIEIVNSEAGAYALRFTPAIWRVTCGNWALGTRPTWRLRHSGSMHRIERDLRKDVAGAIEAARYMLAAWRSSPSADRANELTDAAKDRALLGRLADERRALGLLASINR